MWFKGEGIEGMKWKIVFKWLVVLVVVGLIFWGNKRYLNVLLKEIRVWVLLFGVFVLLIFIGIFIVRFFVLFLVFVIFIVGGFVFGLFFGMFYMLFGLMCVLVVLFFVVGLFVVKKNGYYEKLEVI